MKIQFKTLLAAPLAVRKKIYLSAKKEYYNNPTGKTALTDAQFDRLEDSIKEDDPTWAELKKTGTAVSKKVKVLLPYKMPSLNKVKADNGSAESWINNQVSKGTKAFLLSEKLDGTSLGVVYEDGLPRQAFTRGDGTHGGDVSFLLPHLKIPKRISYTRRFGLRCEGIFTRTQFLKYKNEFDSARNAASGIMNRKSDAVHTAIKDLNLVVISLLEPNIEPYKGIQLAKKLGFRVVAHKLVSAESITPARLSKLLDHRSSTSKYSIDGLVLAANRVNPKATADKPDWAVAFKENVSDEDAPITTVLGIEYNVSSDGRIVPKAILKPVQFDGATVKRATLNNAQWMIERKIGPGAVVRLVRSGEIIPKIIKVEKPGKIQLPAKADFGQYKWDANKTHLVLVNKSDSADYVVKRNLKFFTTLGVDFIGLGVMRKLYDAGMTSVLSILKASPQKFLQVEGFQEKSANKLHESIQKLFTGGVLLPKLMHASGMFDTGLGSKRFEAIQKVYPNILKLFALPADELRAKILNLPGFSQTTTKLVVEGAPKFVRYFSKLGIQISAPTKVKTKSAKLGGVNVTWTGYRDKNEEKTVVENGGNIVPFGGSTNVLIYSPTGKASSKVDKAKAKGITLMTWDKFAGKYGLR